MAAGAVVLLAVIGFGVRAAVTARPAVVSHDNARVNAIRRGLIKQRAAAAAAVAVAPVAAKPSKPASQSKAAPSHAPSQSRAAPSHAPSQAKAAPPQAAPSKNVSAKPRNAKFADEPADPSDGDLKRPSVD